MAFVLCAAPAFAQDSAPATPPDPNVQAQTNPADTDQGAAQTDDDAVQTAAGQDQGDDSAIVVTGLRRSLQSAQNIKRNSDQIVDAIVAEDIGKLPDITVSDTAARIPGVFVERGRGEAGRVLLRGFDERFYATTYNSREIFTAETRSVALQDFPSGNIAALEAFKTSTADLIEPGISGLVNVRGRRPFDFKGFEVAGSAWALYPNQSRDVTPNGNLLITDRWNVGDGEMGALINFSYTKLHYRDSIRRHAFFIAPNLGGAEGGKSPDWPELQYNDGVRKRPSVNAALQWRPNPDLELYAEGLWQGYRDDVSDRWMHFPLWGGASYENLDVDADGNVISGTVNGPGSCCGVVPEGWQGATKRRTNTYQFAVGGSYDAGPLRIMADLARTTSTFKLRAESIDFRIPTTNFSINWYTGRPGGYGPTFEFVGLDFSDPSIYNYRGFWERRQKPQGDDWQARLDFEYEPAGIDFIPKIQWGARYVNRDASDIAGEHYWAANIPISQVPLNYVLYPRGFRGDDHAPYPTRWYGPSFNSVWDDLAAFRQWNIDNASIVYGNNDTNPPDPYPQTQFDINEKSLAGYAQANFGFTSGDVSVDGIVGLRVVRTRENIHGFSVLDDAQQGGVGTPIHIKNSYTDWLPNANVNIRFATDWQLRLAATKTRTRPQFSQLNPSLVLAQPVLNCDPTQTVCTRTGSGGNPFLKPIKSFNLDASLEYYFSRTGFASIGAFYRHTKGFIVNQTFEYPDPDPLTGFPLLITGPVNTNKGNIKGFEAQVRTFLDFAGLPDWVRSFGVEANVTYIDAKAQLPLFCPPSFDECVPTLPFDPNATVRNLPIPDVSKWGGNLVGMYENGPFSLRLAYNWRGHYPEGPYDQRRETGPGGLPVTNYILQGKGRPPGRLDLSTSYTLSDNLTFFLDWTNILNKPFKSDIVRTNYANGQPTDKWVFPMVVRYEERILSGGVRFRFGGEHRSAPAAPAVAPPPPPPPIAVEPAPEMPPPPPPPPPAPERG